MGTRIFFQYQVLWEGRQEMNEISSLSNINSAPPDAIALYDKYGTLILLKCFEEE